MTERQRRELLRSQQGEIDAVLMYNALAEAVGEGPDAETFRRLAAEEGRHGAVFTRYTGRALEPKKTKAVLLPALYRMLGKRRLYPLIARGEYGAAKGYARLVPDFPEVEGMLNDENRHGDTVLKLLEEPERQGEKAGAHWKALTVTAGVFAVTLALLRRRK